MSTETIQRKPAKKTAPTAAAKPVVEEQAIVDAPPTDRSRPAIKRNLKDKSKQDAYYFSYGGGVYLKLANNRVNVYDEESGRVREIRYCANEPSIWRDEQSDAATRSQVIFRQNVLMVPYTKPNLREFLSVHPGNVANGGSIFKMADTEAKVESTIDRDFLITDAIQMIKSRSIEELLPVALSLNINTNQENIAIKRALVNAAKTKPQEFIDLFDNPIVQTRVSVMQAFDFQILRYKGGAITWFDSGAVIVGVPVGQDEVDVLTRFCLTDKGSSVLTEIERQLSEIA